MSKYEAAVLLVKMVSDLRASGFDQDEYHEAVALACKELIVGFELNSVMFPEPPKGERRKDDSPDYHTE